MTRQKHLKRRVRERMSRTGESYCSARRHVVPQATSAGDGPLHLPGSVPASAALLNLLARRGLAAASGGDLASEALLFGIVGGIGAGVFTFRYKEEDVSTFFVAGRHRWEDDLAWFQEAADRLGIGIEVRETTDARTADRHLREGLEQGPVVAWVDLAHLPYRGYPDSWSGSGYHVIVVHEIEDDRGVARVGDLQDRPAEVSLPALAGARQRIGKQKNRVLWLADDGAATFAAAPRELIRGGLESCIRGLVEGRSRNFTLEAFHDWGERLRGKGGKDSWKRLFPPGPNLWRALTSVYEFIESHHTGGGLMRPLFADFLEEAAELLDDGALAELGGRYRRLGEGWTALARAALPDDVEPLRRARELAEARVETYLTEEADDGARVRELWARQEALAADGSRHLEQEGEGLARRVREDLGARVRDLHGGEVEARQAMAAWLAKGR